MSSTLPQASSRPSPHLLGLLAAPVFAGLMFVFLPESLSDPARMLAAILTWVVVMWITEPIPLPVTALLGCGLCVLAGLDTMKSVFAAFSHPIIFLFIGSFFISEALTVHGLDRRFGNWLLSRKWVGSNPIRIMMALSLAVAGMSMWISNTAATAVMLPIALGVLNALRQSGKDLGKFEVGFLLCLAYGAGIGGVATLIGTPPNLLGIGLLAEQANITIAFDQWMMLGCACGGNYASGDVFGVVLVVCAVFSKNNPSILHLPWTTRTICTHGRVANPTHSVCFSWRYCCGCCRRCCLFG